MNKILVVCGPTATGKTELALKLSKIFNGVLISADSRQVYKGMDIGTGKDIDRVGEILGYDLALPKENFSVSQYLKFVKSVIPNIWKLGKLPILVGGTGLYIKAVTDGIDTADIPRNEKLRENLEKKDVAELFEILAADDPVRAAQMNTSDNKNPRRLIRAIEVALNSLDSKKIPKSTGVKADVLFVGLSPKKEILNDRIAKRVETRIENGLEWEIDSLLKQGVTWEMQSMQSLGYRQFKDYFVEGKSIDEVIAEWTKEEQKYAKRQMVWFGKDKRVNWFDITDKDYFGRVEKLVEKWENIGDAKKN